MEEVPRRTSLVPLRSLVSTLFNRGGNKERFRLPGAGGGSFPLYGGTFARSYSVSIFFGSLGAIEALILSYSLRPCCPLFLFVFRCFVRPSHHTLAKTRPRSHGPRGDLARPRRVSLGKPHLRQEAVNKHSLFGCSFIEPDSASV